MPSVVVTGGTAGVGRATALCFARHGYDVAVIARSQKGLSETVKELESIGIRAIGVSADVADTGQMKKAAHEIANTLGAVDVWINAAMCTVIAPFTEMNQSEYQRVTDVTYHGVINGTREALKLMERRRCGHIIQVGSALAYRSIPLQSAYCGAKSAIRGFTDALRSELAHNHSRIRLTMVHLPGVNTPQFDWSRNKLPRATRPVAPVYQPEAVAEAIFKATIKAPRELWVGKATIESIIGNMFFPGWLDKLMAKKAWGGQMQASAHSQAEADNLFSPVEGHHQSRGKFSHEAQNSVIAIDPAFAGKAALAALGILGGLVWWRSKRRQR
ncbi:SDR family NAD(P)-dependent oxidoreductase [Buttiauxella warmboldiae]|uniref:SDR family NAD(P)-dependent oxidoreductase n=1 Tax=Buttiauxella warmboldiae TaxID=82993 RepID=A0A3N5DRN4_9ENTR|nr:SDR family oxidoreductase [Buttiauxella warmboldiae]RPH30217.1 SDR family NAD(P)-dependent oxidoreductase [Buttiauxella warmboldiae]